MGFTNSPPVMINAIARTSVATFIVLFIPFVWWWR